MPKEQKKCIIDYGVMSIECRECDKATIIAIWKRHGLYPIRKTKKDKV